MRGNSLRSNPRPANSMEQDSFDSFDDEDMLVMSTNSALSINSVDDDNGGAPNNLGVGGNDRSADDDLPKSVVVTNVSLDVFDNEESKANFECSFREFDPSALFHYLRSFRRIRVDFASHLAASRAKASMDATHVGQNVIHCYFIQVLSPCHSEDAFLHVPPLEKQFLISPPCSPPVGWEQPPEDRPVVDYDLLAAMAQLTPGEKHELHPTSEINVLGKSVSTPSIVVHIAEEDQTTPAINLPPGAIPKTCKPKVANGTTSHSGKPQKTKCPDRQSSLD